MITEQLSRFIAGSLDRPLPAEVAEKGSLHVLDTMAAMISGSRLLPGQQVIPFVDRLGGRPDASVLATSILTAPDRAALANGVFGHADETDDSNGNALIHPGCAIVPAALAIAELEARSGTDLLRAVVLGYDVGARISKAMGASRLADRYHMAPQAWASTFGATAAACALLRLAPDAVAHALSYAVQLASGNRCWIRDPDHIQKAFVFGGMPASAGVQAAMMAAAKLTGVRDAIEGVPGLLAAFPETANPSEAIDGLGERFEVMQTTIKKWSVGNPNQAPLDCIDTVVREEGIVESDVARIDITLPEQRTRVVDSAMSDINMRHVLALFLVDGGVTFASLHDQPRMQDPEILRVAQKVSITPRAGAGRRELAHFTLTTTDGREFRLTPTTVRGHPDNPMSVQEVADKATDLIASVIDPTNGERLIERLLELDAVADVRDLRKLWQG